MLIVVRHRGFFDYGNLLQSIQGWCASREYFFNIAEYVHKGGDTGVDVGYRIEASRKITEYVKFQIECKVKIANMRDVELVQDGKKIKTQEGQVIVEITDAAIYDWQKQFSGSKFLKHLGTFLQKRILKYKIGDYWNDMALAEAQKLASTIRTTLGQEVS